MPGVRALYSLFYWCRFTAWNSWGLFDFADSGGRAFYALNASVVVRPVVASWLSSSWGAPAAASHCSSKVFDFTVLVTVWVGNWLLPFSITSRELLPPGSLPLVFDCGLLLSFVRPLVGWLRVCLFFHYAFSFISGAGFASAVLAVQLVLTLSSSSTLVSSRFSSWDGLYEVAGPSSSLFPARSKCGACRPSFVGD